MQYVDGFVLPLPKSKLAEYREIAIAFGSICREFGALEVRECVADDVSVGAVTSFPRSVQLKDDETVVFSWIVYPSKAVRDAANARIMSDPRVAQLMDPTNMLFDGKRMFTGGFTTLVSV